MTERSGICPEQGFKIVPCIRDDEIMYEIKEWVDAPGGGGCWRGFRDEHVFFPDRSVAEAYLRSKVNCASMLEAIPVTYYTYRGERITYD